jgi:hypothetical protein
MALPMHLYKRHASGCFLVSHLERERHVVQAGADDAEHRRRPS